VIRVVLPAHLKNLAHVTGEVRLDLPGPDPGARPDPGAGRVTQRAVLDTLEARYPMLVGTIRDRHSGKRRAFVRFYACEKDLSNESPDAPLPERVIAGEEPLIILGAMAGG
jgi:molybdopterin synthase sulfur carrier subunit